MDTFHTARMLAERPRPEDFPEWCQLLQDPRVAATLGGPRSEARLRRDFDVALEHWARYGFGVWMFRDPADGRLIGRCGLRHAEVEGHAERELLYALRFESWGQGLATEMAAASLEVGLERLGLEDVVAFTLTTNSASRRVMEKVGMRYERDITHADLPHVLFRLTAAEWHRGPVRERFPLR
ncbi:GNAT family N-acetyltransferase [Archangium gephyra]|uniref:GNAT family N-acetyltransferase n=1 Tax=Archangium gephyra TaxID=48 RepID=UPI0035D4A1C2